MGYDSLTSRYPFTAILGRETQWGSPKEHGRGYPMASIYKTTEEGVVLEVRNWGHRKPKDVAICRPLSSKEQETYFQMRERGFSDSGIWVALHPDWPGVCLNEKPLEEETVTLSLEDLTKYQILKLMRQKIGTPLKSLEAASEEDLKAILQGLLSRTTVEVKVS